MGFPQLLHTGTEWGNHKGKLVQVTVDTLSLLDEVVHHYLLIKDPLGSL